MNLRYWNYFLGSSIDFVFFFVDFYLGFLGFFFVSGFYMGVL